MNGTYYAAFRFAAELLLAASVYVFPFRHQRKEGFGWKLLFGIAACMGASVLLGHWSQQVLFFMILRYAVLFLLVTGLLHWCFDLGRYGALFCAVSAYATQHFMIKLFYFLQQIVSMSLGEEIISYLAHMAFWYTVFYILFARRTCEQDFTQLVRWDVLTLCGVLLLCNVVLSLWSHDLDGAMALPVKGICAGYACLCCLLILIIQFGIFQRGKLQNEMEMMAYLWDSERRQYQISKDNMELISIKCHDMKHILSTLEPRISPEEKEELSGMIKLYDSSVKTGCEVLDVVLAEKSVLCRQRKITFTCMADGEKLSFVSQSDLYSLFGNAVDNAIEAVSQMEETDERIIDLVVTAQRGMVVIHTENYYTGILEMKNGLPITSKPDKNYHGFGVRSIQLIAEKYGGTMTCSTVGNIFHLNILLPIPDSSK